MDRFKIKVKVELVECNESERSDLNKEQDGSFSIVMSGQDAVSIDKVESLVLRTAYPSIREAVSEHLAQISKKKLVKESKREKGKS